MKRFCFKILFCLCFFGTEVWAINPGAEREGLGKIGGRAVSSVDESEAADYDFASLEEEQKKDSNRGPSQDFREIKKKQSPKIEEALSYPVYQDDSDEDYGADVDYQNVEISN